MSEGQSGVPWGQEIWDSINKAVEDECRRTKVAEKFLPLAPDEALSKARTTAPRDALKGDPGRLEVTEGEVVSLIEIWVEFVLTKQQVERESELRTAHTLATRAANLLSQAEDRIIFKGKKAINKSGVFPKLKSVNIRGTPLVGLSKIKKFPTDKQAFKVQVTRQEGSQDRDSKWGSETFLSLAKGYAKLQSNGHYGPYALVLPTIPYADTYAPIKKSSLTITADRIVPLVTAGYYGTGTLPKSRGILVSLGGNSMDLVIGKKPVASFAQDLGDGRLLFRVSERFALRLKDKKAVIWLNFDPLPSAESEEATESDSKDLDSSSQDSANSESDSTVATSVSAKGLSQN